MEVTNQGDVRIGFKNLAILSRIPQQMKGDNQYGVKMRIISFGTIPSGNNSDGQKEVKNLTKRLVKSYATGEPVVLLMA